MFSASLKVDAPLVNLDPLRRLQNPQALHMVWGPKVVQWLRENIANGVDWRGDPVAPLAASTIARKGHSRPLVDSGAMAELMAWESSGNALIAGSMATSEEGAPYPAYVHSGTRRMVAREWAGLQDEKLDQLQEDAGVFVRQVLQEVFNRVK